MIRVIDLNADLGEGVTDDAGLLEVVTSANVACGYHAGDADIMRAVCEESVRRGVAVGAQVSYADRENFGRVPRDVPYRVLREQVADQVGTLSGIAAATGARVGYVKPHGALYSRVADDEEQAQAVLDGSGELPVLGLPASIIVAMARAAGRAAHHEGFPDRAYTPSGRLVPRSEPGAVLHDSEEIAGRAVTMALSGEVASVCVHGDSPGAVTSATLVRRALEEAGLQLRSFV